MAASVTNHARATRIETEAEEADLPQHQRRDAEQDEREAQASRGEPEKCEVDEAAARGAERSRQGQHGPDGEGDQSEDLVGRAEQPAVAAADDGVAVDDAAEVAEARVAGAGVEPLVDGPHVGGERDADERDQERAR